MQTFRRISHPRWAVTRFWEAQGIKVKAAMGLEIPIKGAPALIMKGFEISKLSRGEFLALHGATPCPAFDTLQLF